MRPLLIMVLLAVTMTAAFAQDGPGGPIVDQAVGDLDPLSASLRQVEPGLARFNARAALRELPAAPWTVGMLPAPNGQRYVFEAPGFRAYFDRPDYLVIGRPDAGPPVRRNVSPGIDGGFLPLAPANLVYDLRPRRVNPAPPPEMDPNWVDRRLDTRLGPVPLQRLDSSYDHGATGNLDLSPPPPSPKRPQPRPMPIDDAADPAEPARAADAAPHFAPASSTDADAADSGAQQQVVDEAD